MEGLNASPKLVHHVLAGLLAVTFVVTGFLAGSAPAVQAASAPIQAAQTAGLYQGRGSDERAGWRLPHLLKQELLVLSIQENRLKMAREAAENAQQRIDEDKAAGKDTTAIQAALDTFKSQIEVAQSSWNTAKSILEAKAGFDANGQVTDLQQARDTLREAGRALRDTGDTLRDAAREFRRAVQDYRRNRLK
jgi:uncharacterized protein YukE